VPGRARNITDCPEDIVILETAVVKRVTYLVCPECYNSFGAEFTPKRKSRVNSYRNDCGLLKMQCSWSQLGQFSLKFAPYIVQIWKYGSLE